jgi:transcriptional regulator with XRE-family HTH domain
MRTLDQIIDGLPADQRARVKARGRELIAEEIALRHLRQARKLTQESMANLLGIGQESVSKIENRSDMLLSTLRSYVEAMGGSLRLVAEFPDGYAVISSIGEVESERAVGRAPKERATKRGRRHLTLTRADD